MKNCFENLVWIKDSCENITPTSGLYLNSLEISVEELNKILDEHDGTPEQWLKEKIDFCLQLMQNEVNTQFADKFRKRSILDNDKVGFYNFKTYETVPASSGNLKGVYLEIVNFKNFLDVFVSTITIFVEKTGPVDILVYDILTNRQIDKITADAVAGEPIVVDVNKVYRSNRKRLNLAFVYDSTGIDSHKTWLKDSWMSGGCTSCGGGMYYTNRWMKFSGVSIAKTDPKVLSSLKRSTDTAGLSIEYTIQCNATDWLCTFSNLLALPLLYKVGVEVCQKALTSARTNKRTLLDSDKYKTRMEWFEKKYNESFNSVLDNIKPPLDDCFECKSPVKYTHNFGY